MRARRDVLGYVIAIVFGCIAVYVDDHNDEVQAAVVVLLVGGLMIGLVGARQRWIAAAVLGTSILVSHLLASRLRMGSEFAQSAPNAAMFLPLVPAFIGAAVGAGLRVFVPQS